MPVIQPWTLGGPFSAETWMTQRENDDGCYNTL